MYTEFCSLLLSNDGQCAGTKHSLRVAVVRSCCRDSSLDFLRRVAFDSFCCLFVNFFHLSFFLRFLLCCNYLSIVTVSVFLVLYYCFCMCSTVSLCFSSIVLAPVSVPVFLVIFVPALCLYSFLSLCLRSSIIPLYCTVVFGYSDIFLF